MGNRMVSRSIWNKRCKGYFKIDQKNTSRKAARDILGVLKYHEHFGPQQFFTFHGQSFDEWGRLPYPFSQRKQKLTMYVKRFTVRFMPCQSLASG